MRRTIPTDPTDRTLYLLVAVVAVTGLLVAVAALADLVGVVGDPVAAPPWQWLVAYLVLVLVSQRLVVEVRIRSTRFGLSWTDAVVLVGLSIMPMSWVVLAAAAGVLIARLINRSRPSRVLFAIGKNLTMSVVAGLVLHGLTALASDQIGPQLVWLSLAFVVMTGLDKLLTTSVVALSSRTSLTERLWANLDIELAALAGRLAVTLVAVLLLYGQPHLLYALPLLVLFAHVWHEQWLRAREERRSWQELAATTASFTDVELDTVVRRAVTGGSRLFSAEVLEVELWLPPPRRLVRGDADQVTYDGDPADAPPEPELAEVHTLDLHGCPAKPGIGTLRLRFRDRVKLSEREQAMLATYVAALETAVRNAAAYGLLKHAGSG